MFELVANPPAFCIENETMVGNYSQSDFTNSTLACCHFIYVRSSNTNESDA